MRRREGGRREGRGSEEEGREEGEIINTHHQKSTIL